MNPAIDRALRDLLSQLDAEVRAKGPTCWSSGKCCQFDAYGHRLYVTGLEIAWFLMQPHPEKAPSHMTGAGEDGLPILTPSSRSAAEGSGDHSGGGRACPYQVDKRCMAHAVRPMGCRVFFCQQGTDDWQQDLYERYLAQLRALHQAHGLTYHYMDWMAGLSAADRAVGQGGE